MSKSEDKLPKPNGLGIDPMQRLASFKPPRDYTLGAAKANKKVFTPNLNVSRNKSKGAASTNSNQKKEEKSRKDRKNDKNNKNSRYGQNIIKSDGVFSQGVGSGERHSTRKTYDREASDTTPTLQRPHIRIKDMIKFDKELEEKKIKSIMGQANLANEDVEDFKSLDYETPIKLPFDDIGRFKQGKPEKVKQEVVVKTEPEDPDIIPPERKSLPTLKKEVYEENDVVDLLMNDQPTLVLIKFPDTLPGRGAADDEDAPRRKPAEEPSTSKDQDEKTPPEENRCYLKHLEEGRIGKLQIRRSGRVTLLLGDTALEVNIGTKSVCYQELMSVASNDDSRSANIVSLGPLQHKLTVVPDWDGMFLDIPS